jgi:hypothetical protein
LAHDISTQSEGSADLSDLLSILPGTIASLKDAGMYEDWLHYVRIVSENVFPLKKSDKSAEPSLCVDMSCANGSTPYIDSSNISAVMSSSSE